LRLDPAKNLQAFAFLCPSHLAAHAQRESPPKLASRDDLDFDGNQRTAIGDDQVTV
jgi:hypothetical protein